MLVFSSPSPLSDLDVLEVAPGDEAGLEPVMVVARQPQEVRVEPAAPRLRETQRGRALPVEVSSGRGPR